MKTYFSIRIFLNRISLSMILMFVFSFTNAQTVLTLTDAFKIALENNYSIQVAKNDLAVATINNSAGAAGMLPSVVGTASQDNQQVNTQQKYLSGATNNRNNAKSNTLGANVELGWTIFDGFKMFATKNRLEELQKVGEWRMRNNIEQIFIRITRAYYDVMQNTQQVKASQELVLNSERRLALAEEKVKAGKSAKTEALKARVDLNTDRSAMLRAQQLLKNSRVLLNQLLARDLQTEFAVPDAIPKFTEYKLDELTSKAGTQNSGLQLAKRNQHITQLTLNEIRAERMPQIQLKSGYNFSKQESEAGFLQSSQNNGFHYGAGLSLNLFNGFDVNRRIRMATLAMKSSDLVYRDSMTRIQQAIIQAFNNYTTGKQLTELETQNVDVARENFLIADEQYKQGVITSLEVRDAQQNLLNSELRLFSAQYETRLAEADLLRLSGELFRQD